ncbi:hypothetical protein J9B83_15450 [Marinomonas sp. A79]|uniref:Uncharacterized protein n=1 Tax=Marinomonas vulgaris TaxID=2823372 RepID=A0ABS5HHE4_9GAMM|nr:hypothetical protein [Marinomonas vulgaris]MBR7890289.1 hypothetical protein [Marinomonas vulgaris]
MNISRIPKPILLELEKTGINKRAFETNTPDQLFSMYTINKGVPFDASRLVVLFDYVQDAKMTGQYRKGPNYDSIFNVIDTSGLSCESMVCKTDEEVMASLIAITHKEYAAWGTALCKILHCLRAAFTPYIEAKESYKPCRDVSTFEINNNAVMFNFNAKIKEYDDPKSDTYSRQYLMSVESRSNQGFKSIQLSASEIATLYMVLDSAIKHTLITEKNYIAQRESTSVVIAFHEGKGLQIYHNTKEGNRFAGLKGADVMMLKAKCLQILKLSLGMSGAEVVNMLAV